jgi:hypothetical protein
MSVLTIFLGIVIFILLFTGLLYLYNRFLKGAVIYDLKKTNPELTVSKPTSSNYYFSVWIYVNSFKNQNVKNNYLGNAYEDNRAEIGKPIFYYGGQFATKIFTYDTEINAKTAVDFVYLQLGANSPKLQYYFSPIVTGDYQKCQVIDITENLPLQKWTHVIISTVGSILEFYLDGKLVKTYTHIATPNVVANSNTRIQIGTQDKPVYHDIFISRLQRVPQGVDAKTAFDLYKKGPGTGLNMGSSKYDFSLKLSQNDKTIKTISASSIANIFK